MKDNALIITVSLNEAKVYATVKESESFDELIEVFTNMLSLLGIKKPKSKEVLFCEAITNTKPPLSLPLDVSNL